MWTATCALWPAAGQHERINDRVKSLVRRAIIPLAGVAELADAQDLKSWVPQGACGFDSRPRQSLTTIWGLRRLGYTQRVRGFGVRRRSSVVANSTVILYQDRQQPRRFIKSYAMPKDRQPYQDLKRLNLRRNALLHMKENITKLGKVIKGKLVGNYTEQDEHEFVKRCRTLTDRLIEHLGKFDHSADLVNLGIV